MTGTQLIARPPQSSKSSFLNDRESPSGLQAYLAIPSAGTSEISWRLLTVFGLPLLKTPPRVVVSRRESSDTTNPQLRGLRVSRRLTPVSYTHLRAHETVLD